MERCPHGGEGYRRSKMGGGVGLRFGFAEGVDLCDAENVGGGAIYGDIFDDSIERRADGGIVFAPQLVG